MRAEPERAVASAEHDPVGEQRRGERGGVAPRGRFERQDPTPRRLATRAPDATARGDEPVAESVGHGPHLRRDRVEADRRQHVERRPEPRDRDLRFGAVLDPSGDGSERPRVPRGQVVVGMIECVEPGAGRSQFGEPLGAHVQHPEPGEPTQPLVRARGEHVDTGLGHIEREHAEPLDGVDDAPDLARPAHRRDRRHIAPRARIEPHPTERDRERARTDRRRDRLGSDDAVGRRVDDPHPELTAPLAGEERIHHRAVVAGKDDDLVAAVRVRRGRPARPDRQRLRGEAESVGGVADEPDLLGRRTDERGNLRAHAFDRLLVARVRAVPAVGEALQRGDHRVARGGR